MSKKRVRIGKYKKVFKGITFEIQQAKAVLPNGQIKIFEKAVRPPTVTILAIDDRGRLLLIREYRTKHKRYLWRLPSGRVDKEKSPIKASQRELREETGFKAKKLKLFHLSDTWQSLDWKRYSYLATGLIAAPLEGDEDEDIIVAPTSISKAYKMVKDGEIENENMAYLIWKLYKFRKKIKF